MSSNDLATESNMKDESGKESKDNENGTPGKGRERRVMFSLSTKVDPKDDGSDEELKLSSPSLALGSRDYEDEVECMSSVQLYERESIPYRDFFVVCWPYGATGNSNMNK